MENAYGIGITNRYALFLDEEADPLDILKQSEQDQLAAKNKKIEAATKPASKAAPVKTTNTKNESGKFKIISLPDCWSSDRFMRSFENRCV